MCNWYSYTFQPEPLPDWFTPCNHEKMQAKASKNVVRKVSEKVSDEADFLIFSLQGCNRIAVKGKQCQADFRGVGVGQKNLLHSQVSTVTHLRI